MLIYLNKDIRRIYTTFLSNFAKMFQSKWLFILFFIMPFHVLASHNRGGEITYIHVGGLTYEFTITTCTDLGSSTGTDRPELSIDFDIGTPYAQRDTFQRVSSTPLLLNHQKNTYVGIHTFTSTGSHRITIEDPNRNAGILNVFPGGNSDDIVFSLETYLIASPFQGSFAGNNSVQFDDCPCPEIGCVGKEYCYNPMAYDPDGDSLSYQLVPPLGLGANSLVVPNYYVFPEAIGGGNFSIDPVFGTICWDNPMQQGEYNFTIKVSEWRNTFLVGSVLRDVQLTIQNNCQNDPPQINPIPDQCAIAGDTISFQVQGSDQNQDVIELLISGLPLNLSNSPANFSSVSSPGITNGIFQWKTTCDHISKSSYSMMVELEDNGQPVFSDYESINIDVRPPQLTGFSAQAVGSNVTMSWNKASCPNAIGYNLYRKANAFSPPENCCNNPNINGLGVTLIEQKSSINDTTYIDNSILTIGVSYCYIVTAIYDYGMLESCPSDTACATLKKEVPIITNISVINTDAISGIDSIAWTHPTELDTLQYPGPYFYEIMDELGNSVVQLSPSLSLNEMDTNYTYLGVNTTDTNRRYKIALHYTQNSSDSLVGYSTQASSVHLNSLSSDNQIELKWSENVPWINYQYFIYRGDSLNDNFFLLDSSISSEYLDSGLINNIDYCYYIEAFGEYADSTIKAPVVNKSQIICAKPFDYTPPPPPEISIDTDSTFLIDVNGNLVFQSINNCDVGYNTFNWTNPNNNGADDAVSYNLYFKPFLDSTFNFLKKIEDINDTSFQHNYLYNGTVSIAGCYYVTATDSILYNNESISSDTVCFDNCPSYILPNIFTPNNDNNNDFFQALIPIKYISDIHLSIFNRWGEAVYESTDPEFKWNGENLESAIKSPSGIYFFKCVVNTIRISGIEPLELNGFIHLIRKNNTINK